MVSTDLEEKDGNDDEKDDDEEDDEEQVRTAVFNVILGSESTASPSRPALP